MTFIECNLMETNAPLVLQQFYNTYLEFWSIYNPIQRSNNVIKISNDQANIFSSLFMKEDRLFQSVS